MKRKERKGEKEILLPIPKILRKERKRGKRNFVANPQDILMAHKIVILLTRSIFF